MLVDAHNHPNLHGFGADRIIQDMDEQGIDQAWLMTWDSPQSEYDVPASQAVLPPTAESGIPLTEVLEVARQAPEHFVLGYAPHPKRPDAVQRIKSAVELHGVRVAGEYKSRVVFDDPDAIRLLRAFGELGLPVTIDLEYSTQHGGANFPWSDWWYGGTIEALERAVVACPDTVFIGHGAGWWAHVSGDDLYDKTMYPTGPVVPGGETPRMLETYPNMYADLSATSGLIAITRDREYGRRFIIDQADKLLFGRDSYDSRLLDHLGTLELPTEVWDKVSYRNALRLLGED